MKKDNVKDAVRAKYAAVAESDLTNRHKGVEAVAKAFGYSAQELGSIPAEANMGLSCGNPIALASLRPGEVVVDLGSGGGLDVFLASEKVGPGGKAIGIDMTPSMIERAKKAAQNGPGGKPYSNVEFHLASIDRLPLPDNSVDCVISNCVINLAPDKPAVFREIARVLKPGGRVAVSDIALKKPLPGEIAADVMAYVGCIAGAILMDDYRQQLKAAGFQHVEIIDSGADLNAYTKIENQSGCCSPVTAPASASAACCDAAKTAAPASACCDTRQTRPSASPCCTESAPASPSCCSSEEKAGTDLHGRLAELLRRYNINDYAASVKVLALKPR